MAEYFEPGTSVTISGAYMRTIQQNRGGTIVCNDEEYVARVASGLDLRAWFVPEEKQYHYFVFWETPTMRGNDGVVTNEPLSDIAAVQKMTRELEKRDGIVDRVVSNFFLFPDRE